MRVTPPLRNRRNAAIAKRAILIGYKQHDIAAYFRDNQGRVSEIKTGKLFRDLAPADQLPADFPPLA